MSFGIPVRNGLMLGLVASTALSTRGGRTSPAMYLNFLQPFLDSRITFSRGTNATLIDSTGKLTYAPNNLLVWSETLSETSWVKSNVTVSGNAVTATASTGNHRLQRTAAAPYSFIFWVEATAGTQRYIQLYNGATTGMYANFDLVAGTVGTVGAQASASIVNLGEGRYRCALVINGAVNPNNSHLVGMITAANAAWGESWTATGGETFTLHLAQLEAVTYQTTPSTYVATTASAYYGPRFDYDPVTLAPRGLLIEEARTNLLTYSDQFNNAAWGVAGLTVTANTTVAPSGVTEADTITGSSGSNAVIFPSAGFSASATSYTASCYVKAGSAAWIVLSMWQGSGTLGINVWFNAQTGAVGSNNATAGYVFTSASSTAVGNGWYRITVTGTVPVSTVFWSMRIVDGDNAFVYTNTVGDTMFIWGAQLETGAFATSYIPTVASTVTRNAENAVMTGTNFSTWYNQTEGTFIIDSAYSPVIGTSYGLACAFQGASNFININNNGNRSLYINVGGVVQVDLSPGGYAAYAPAKIASAYKVNDFATTINARTVLTDTSGTLPAPTELRIGRDAQDLYINNHIRAIAYYNTRLPNTQLQTLTAPSLASPLALDFISPTYTVGY